MKPLTPADLDALYGQPKHASQLKILKRLDRHSKHFIALSPFCVVASAGADRTQDVSPRGGPPGFVRVIDDKTLMMPDRPGNNLLDSLRNLAEGNGQVGMLFLIPGFDETLRLNGRSELIHDPALCEDFAEFGKPARSVMKITVEEVFFQCGKALMRSRLWEPDAIQDRGQMPSLSDMITEQASLDRPAESHAAMVSRYKDSL